MGVKTARMTKMPVGIAARVKITVPAAPTRVVLTALQIPTYPISPPPGAENLGKISWDQPEMIRYVAGTEISAYVEMINPSDEQRLYCISYYFLSPDGIVAEEGLLDFVADTQAFQAFYLPAQGVEPAFTSVQFSVSECDFTFGLRMLLLELTDSVAEVIQETSRVQVMLASEETYKKHYGPTIEDFLPMPPDMGPPLPRLLG
ncbi:unnamed protein product, partial [marine sediment metagenome]